MRSKVLKHLHEYLGVVSILTPPIIILKRVTHGIYFRGNLKDVPSDYKGWYVLEHSSLKKKQISFVIIEDANR